MTLWLDIGTSSIWWALIEEKGEEKKFIDGWVRIFHEPREADSKKTLNTRRREKRGQRRILARRNDRIETLKKHLINYWFYPKDTKEQSQYYAQNPYELRTKWLDEKLDLYDLWRALLHIWQRRGFKSNRKTPLKKEESWLLKEISDLQNEIETNNCRTLGEYFHKVLLLDWHDVRGKHTRREMYETEFDAIIKKQKEFYPELETTKIQQLRNDIFFQNPLRLQKDLIGECLFFPHRQRAHSLSLWSQEFRIWQDINNLRYFDSYGDPKAFSPNQREKLFAVFQKSAKVTFSEIKKTVWLHRDTRINFEKTRKFLKGNTTNSQLVSIIWEYWNTLDREKKDELVRYLIDIQSIPTLSKVLKEKFGDFLSDENIENLVKLDFSSSNYMNLSEKAIKKIIPILKEKTQEKTTKDGEILEQLPITYREAIDVLWLQERVKYDFSKDKDLQIDYRNPSVTKAMVEVKKIAKAIEQRYGIPETVRIELGKEMKYSEEKLKELKKKQKENEEKNNETVKKVNEIFQSLGFTWVPTRDDIMKYKLFLECETKGFSQCPYTGKTITPRQVFSGEVDVEHIIPWSRSLDDSYTNKTLCYADFNRQIKVEKTPYEIFSWNPEEYEKVKQRIKDYPYKKRAKFEQKEIDKDKFLAQQLVDTQYIWQEIRSFLEAYFDKKSKINITKWQLTAVLRYSWGWNRFLWDINHDEEQKKKKNRRDHRHHLIDAVAIALTSQSILQKASILSGQNKVLKKEEIFWTLHPWATFEQDFEDRLKSVIISFAQKHKISWAFHKETGFWILSIETATKLKIPDIKNGIGIFIKRVQLDETLKAEKINTIYDKTIRELVANHMRANEDDSKKAFPKVWDWKLFHKDGKTPIKSVRIWEKKSLEWIYNYKWKWNLFYETGSNHHVEILEHTRKTNKDGTPLRRWIFITMLEAGKRAGKKAPVVQRTWPWQDGEEILPNEDWKFVMSLIIDDMVEINERIYRVNSMSWAINYIRLKSMLKAEWEHDLQKTPNTLIWKKIQVSPLGIKYQAND